MLIAVSGCAGRPGAAGHPAGSAPAAQSPGGVARRVSTVAADAATVVIPANAMSVGYATTHVVLGRGGTLNAVNLDTMEHTVTSVARDAAGTPLFSTLVEPGATTTVPGVGRLAAGSYPFYCEFHPSMRGTLVITGAGGGVHPVAPKFEQPLVAPPVLTGAHLSVRIRRAPVRVLPHGPKTMMWTFGGSYPGPTIERPVGHRTTVTFSNRLPAGRSNAVTVHLHGDHHSSAADGQPTRYLIRPGAQRTYTYPLTDGGRPEQAAFDFYHDHLMNETGRHNWLGLQGMFITHSRAEAALRLPSGRYDVPLLISDRSFGADNQLTNHFAKSAGGMGGMGGMTGAPPGDQTVGDRILVDGRFAPYLRVSTHRYRLRLLNASNFQSYDFALSDGRPFVQIGTGASLLPAPVVRQDILLGPAQRADVVVDFHGTLHHRIVLESIPRTDGSKTGIGTPTAAIMQFHTVRTVRDRSRLPATLLRVPAVKASTRPALTWTLGLGGSTKTGTYWTINGRPFDPHRIDARVRLGSTQTWLIRNTTTITHYVHLHEEAWHTVRRDGRAPPAWERGLVDTWRLDPGESIEVAARFTDYTGVFMLHCHMLDHEDDGMMAQFDVVRRLSDPAPSGYYLQRGRH